MKMITPIIKEVKTGGLPMIRFDKLWKTMERQGITTYQLREKCGIDSKTIRRLRENENMETKTLNKLCEVLSCRLEDIAEYIED
jgi:DNA-binding Xre family transcriptional regulator